MNKSESDAFLFFTNNHPPAIALVFSRLYHWGTISWDGHEAGDWFFKSIRDISKELGVMKSTVQRAYKIIQANLCPLFQSRIEKKKNFNITYIKITPQGKNSQNHSTDNEYSKESTIPVMSTALYRNSVQYRTDNEYGINIVTHNKNSLYTRDAREAPKVDEQQMIDVPNRQTDDCLKMVEIWNELIRPSKPETMSTRREQQCFEVLRDHFNNDLDNWQQHCVRITQSSWLTGNDFTLYLGWALKPERIEEVRNGKYVDNAHKLAKKALAESSKQLPTLPLDEALSDCTSEVDRKVKEILFYKLGPVTYAAWIKGRAFEMKGNQICIISCGDYTRKRIEQDFGDQLKQAYAAVYNSLSDCKSSLIDHREGVDIDLLIYGNKALTSSGDVLWA